MPVARGNANSLVKEFMAFQTFWESQKNDPKSDTVLRKKSQNSALVCQIIVKDGKFPKTYLGMYMCRMQ